MRAENIDARLSLGEKAGFACGHIPNQEQTVEAIYGVHSMLAWIPAVVGFGAAALMYFNPLTDKRMQEITSELARVRSAAVAST